MQHLVSQPVILEHPAKQPSLSAALQLVRIARVLEEVLAFLVVTVVILEAVENDAWHHVVLRFLGVEEKEILQLFLGFSDLERNKISHTLYTEARVLMSDCFTIF